MTFKDHFSARAALYATYRPRYPAALFEFVASLTNQHRLAVDVGSGNGQAALGLAEHFERVMGVDPSASQIDHAVPHSRVEYRVAAAESTGLPSRSADLVAAAQALHWFDAPAFFAEVRRLLVPHGAIAIWGYGDPILEPPSLQTRLHQFNRGLLEEYWNPERGVLLAGYSTIEFPFEEVPAPTLNLEARWTLAELSGYLRTWSATSNFVAARGFDPVIELEESMAREWGDPAMPRAIRWPLHIRAGILPTTDR